MAEPQLNAETEPSGLRWVMLGLIFLATVINYLCRQAYSVSATTLQQVFSLSNEDYGLLTSGFFFAYTLSNGVSGPIIDRLGAKRGYLLCMFLWSSAVGLIGAAQNVWMLAGFLMLLGLGEAGNWPAAVKVVSEWFPPRERSLASGIFNSGAGIGALVGPPAVGLLLMHLGWRPAFLIVGLIGYGWLIGFALVYRTPANVAAEVARRPPSPGRLLKTRFLLFFALSKVFMDPVWYFYLFWLPKFMTEVHHFNLKQITWLAPVPFIIADIGNLAGGGFTQLLISRGVPIPHARKTGAAVFGLSMVSAIPAIIVHDPYLFDGVGFRRHVRLYRLPGKHPGLSRGGVPEKRARLGLGPGQHGFRFGRHVFPMALRPDGGPVRLLPGLYRVWHHAVDRRGHYVVPDWAVAPASALPKSI